MVERDEVGSRFDPMLAKIVARGEDRAEALDRLARALDDTVVLGLTTNLQFLRWLVREPAVRAGAIRTDTLERFWPPDDWAVRAQIPDAAWSAAAAALQPDDAADPWRGGWRLNATPAVPLESDGEAHIAEPGAADGVTWVRVGDVVHVDVDGRSVAIRLAAPPDVDRAAHRRGGRARVVGRWTSVAPMPGQVRSVEVAARGVGRRRATRS